MGPLDTVERVSQWLLRGRQVHPSAHARLQLVVSGVAIGSMVALVSLPVDDGQGALAIGSFFLLMHGGLLLVRFGAELALVETLELMLVAVFLSFMSLQPTELVPQKLYWFALLPLSGGLILGWLGVLGGGLMGVLSTAVVVGCYHLGIHGDESPTAGLAIQLFDVVTFLLAIGGLTWVYEALRSRATLKAESAAKARADFIASMSHELRTPMNGVLGMTQLLAQTELTSEQREQVGLIVRSGDAMVTLVNELLDFAKLEEGQLQFEQVSFSVRQLFTDVGALFEPQARAHGVRLEVEFGEEVPVWVSGDSLRLGQVLQNLLSNAVKFTRRGTITVKASHHGDRLVGSVSDQGVGMSTVVLSRLFVPFVQADPSIARKHGGTGLGLTISRELCRRMGGDLTVESTPGVGSRFEFSVRVAPSSAPAPAPLPVPVVGRLSGRVLVVDDNLINQHLTRRLCERQGLEVEVASDGAQALARVQAAPFDLVLMDCQMPVMDGFEATRHLRALASPTAKVPVVAVTASAMAPELERCREAGMNAVVTKPIDSAKFIAVLHELLGRR